MPLHDLICTGCDTVSRNIWIRNEVLPEPRHVPATNGPGYWTKYAPTVLPPCAECGAAQGLIPPSVTVDAYEPFQSFETSFQERGEEVSVRVGSLSQMRAIEERTAANARNGEGQPIVFRNYSQDRGTGNHLVNTLGEHPQLSKVRRTRRPLSVGADPSLAPLFEARNPLIGDPSDG